MYRFQVTVEVSYLDGEEGISQTDLADALEAVTRQVRYHGDKGQVNSVGEYIRYEVTDEDIDPID